MSIDECVKKKKATCKLNASRPRALTFLMLEMMLVLIFWVCLMQLCVMKLWLVAEIVKTAFNFSGT